MAHYLSFAEIEHLKRILAGQLPGTKSSHRTEAMARGFGFASNAALLTALSSGSVRVYPDDVVFAAFLDGRSGDRLPERILTAALAAIKFPHEHTAVRTVMAGEPGLSCNGMRTRANASMHQESRASMLSTEALAEFRRAVEWLDTVKRTIRIASRRTSYGYKHDVERYHKSRDPGGDSYLSNGMFIAAAVHMGFRVKPDDNDSPNVLLNLATVDDKPARQPGGNLAGSLRGPKNLAAWRNLMVAGINAGLGQRLFGLRPDDNWWPSDEGTCRFEFDGLPAIVSVSDIGFGELSVKVAVNPTTTAGETIRSFNSGFYAGEAFASGYLERKNGAWLQTPGAPTGSIRRVLLDRLAAVEIAPMGFADSGRFMM